MELKNVCRTCLSTNTNILTKINEEIQTLLDECTSIKVIPRDNYNICRDCINILDEFHKFKRTCAEVNRFFDEQSNDRFESCHEPSKEVPASHTCPHCSKSFKYNTSYKRHVRSHQLKNACPHCNKPYDNKNSLKTHLRTKHNAVDVRHICNICGKKVNYLPKHLKTHENHAFRCSYCTNAQFPTFTELLQHQKTAHGDVKLCARTFECADCGRKYLRQKLLNDHLRYAHSNVTHQCSLCEKNFKRRSGLSEHMRVHTNDRPFACEACGKRYTTRAKLNHHVRGGCLVGESGVVFEPG